MRSIFFTNCFIVLQVLSLKLFFFLISVCFLWFTQQLQPRRKPVETNRENAYIFFLSSWQKLKPPPNECLISHFPLSKVVYDSMAIIHVGFQTKTTLNRRWGGSLLFLFRRDGSRVQKLENRWNIVSTVLSRVVNYKAMYTALTVLKISSRSWLLKSQDICWSHPI